MISRRPALRRNPRRQRGLALIILLTVLGLASLVAIVQGVSQASLRNGREELTSAALAQARNALIGYAVSRGALTGSARPGELPCPDTNDDGVEEGSCTAGRLGRVPWKTLGIAPPRDGGGEIVWYAPAGPFRKSASTPINSDTKGNLTVRAADGVTALTSEAAFVLIAPGAAIGAQKRSTVTAVCATTGTSIAEKNCAANYLDAFAGINNAMNNGPFIQAVASDGFNDQILFVSSRAFMAAVEKRIAKEALAMLAAYRAANGYLPYPARYDAAGCRDRNYLTDCQSDGTVCRGRFPQVAADAGGTTPDWPAMSRPDWFSVNLWGEAIYYGAGTSLLATTPPNCSPTVSVDAGSAGAVFITAGSSGTVARPSTVLADYLEDAANQDGWSTASSTADSYVTPSASTNDRLYTFP